MFNEDKFVRAAAQIDRKAKEDARRTKMWASAGKPNLGTAEGIAVIKSSKQ